MVKTVTTLRDLRLILQTWRQRDETIGFVPTMGALHEGHMALVRHAQSLSTRIVTSIFVNPLQFGPNDDFARYPQPKEQDERLLTSQGCDVLFRPETESMFPHGFATTVDPGAIGTMLEGIRCPDRFAGIATILTKLILQVMPDYVFMGEKDYQQLCVAEQIVRDLQIPVTIIPVPTVRDADGLPFSSRNVFLSPEERSLAIQLPALLESTVTDIREGHDIEAALLAAREQLTDAGLIVEDFDLVDARTLVSTRTLRKPTRLMAAVRVGQTRLTDNMAI